MRLLSPRVVRVCIALAFVLLVAAWAGASPPGAAPDENAHFVKALGVAQGQPVGEPAEDADPPPPGPRQQEFAAAFSKQVHLPPDLEGLPGARCFALQPEETADCAVPLPRPRSGEASSAFLGPEQPFLYAVPGLAAVRVDDPDRALLTARAVAAAGAAVLLAAAATLVPGRVRAAGLVLAVTPMVVFLAGSLSTSGLETTAAVCHGAALLALARGEPGGGRRGLRWVVLAWAVSGVVLALARPLGAAWIAGGLALLLLLAPLSRVRTLVSDRAVQVGAALLGVASAVSAWWTVFVVPHPEVRWSETQDAWAGVDEALVKVGRELVGVFGWTTVVPPAGLTWGWAAVVLALVVAGLALGGWRHRVALVLAVLTVPALAVALELVANAPFGFQVQGRHVLPGATVVPLLAADAVATGWQRRRARRAEEAAAAEGAPDPAPGESARAPRARRWVRQVGAVGAASAFPLLLLAVAVGHGVGWWWSARRHAVGLDGPLGFLGVADWAPAGGWLFWLGVVAAALALLGAAAALEAVRSVRSRGADPPGGRRSPAPRAEAVDGAPLRSAP